MLLFWPLTKDDPIASSLGRNVLSWQEPICRFSRVKAPRSSGPSYVTSCFYSSHKQNESLHSISECCYTQEKEETHLDFSHGLVAHSPGSQVQALSLPPVCFSTQEFIFPLDSSAALMKSTASSSAWYKSLAESKYYCKTGKIAGSHDCDWRDTWPQGKIGVQEKDANL